MSEQVKHKDIVIPKYQFAPLSEEDKKLPPIQRQVLKTMEITESFTVYSVFQHLAKMEKAIADKQAEIDGLEEMKKAYMAEMSVIEKQLGINDLEHEFSLIRLKEIEAEELLKKSPEGTVKEEVK